MVAVSLLFNPCALFLFILFFNWLPKNSVEAGVVSLIIKEKETVIPGSSNTFDNYCSSTRLSQFPIARRLNGNPSWIPFLYFWSCGIKWIWFLCWNHAEFYWFCPPMFFPCPPQHHACFKFSYFTKPKKFSIYFLSLNELLFTVAPLQNLGNELFLR